MTSLSNLELRFDRPTSWIWQHFKSVSKMTIRSSSLKDQRARRLFEQLMSTGWWSDWRPLLTQVRITINCVHMSQLLPSIVSGVLTLWLLDVLFRDSFLLTYRSFMTSTELMEKLIDRYCVTPVQKDLSAAILEALRQKQVPIRSRYARTLNNFWSKD